MTLNKRNILIILSFLTCLSYGQSSSYGQALNGFHVLQRLVICNGTIASIKEIKGQEFEKIASIYHQEFDTSLSFIIDIDSININPSKYIIYISFYDDGHSNIALRQYPLQDIDKYFIWQDVVNNTENDDVTFSTEYWKEVYNGEIQLEKYSPPKMK